MKRLLLTLILACGFVPIRPIPPIGCRDMRPVCECDSSGQNCRWIWICVR